MGVACLMKPDGDQLQPAAKILILIKSEPVDGLQSHVLVSSCDGTEDDIRLGMTTFGIEEAEPTADDRC